MAGELSVNKDWWTRFKNYCNDVRAEMRRVTWPGKQETYSTTVMAIITTFLFAFFFMICDQIFSRAISYILDWGKGLHF